MKLRATPSFCDPAGIRSMIAGSLGATPEGVKPSLASAPLDRRGASSAASRASHVPGANDRRGSMASARGDSSDPTLTIGSWKDAGQGAGKESRRERRRSPSEGFPGNQQVAEELVLLRLLKKVQMQGGARCEMRGVLGTYVAASRERDNAADGLFQQPVGFSRRRLPSWSRPCG